MYLFLYSFFFLFYYYFNFRIYLKFGVNVWKKYIMILKERYRNKAWFDSVYFYLFIIP